MTDNLPETKKWPLPGNPPAQRSETASLMEAIVKLTSSPQFNPEGIERMMVMYERIKDREAQAAFNVAMAGAQQEMRPVATDADNPQTRSRYASYYALDKAVRPIYTKHGLALSFNTAPAERDIDIRVICYVTCGGYVREYSIVMPADGKGARGGDVMTRTHATGSATKYGMRYLLTMIFNIATGADPTDDDGNAAGRKAPRPPRPTESQFITASQVADLRLMLDNSPEREKRFCDRHLDGAPLEDISPLALGDCVNLILDANTKRAYAASQGPAGAFQPERVPPMPPKPGNAPTGPLGANLGPSTGISLGTEGRSLPSGPGYEITLGPDAFDPETGEVTEGDRIEAELRMPLMPETKAALNAAAERRKEVTEPGRPTMRSQHPRPPRPVQNAAAQNTTHADGATSPTQPSDDNGMPWQLRIVPVLEHTPDFGTATLPELLRYHHLLFNIAQSKEEADQIFAHHISDHYKKLPWPPQAETLKGTWDKMVEERLR